MSRRFSELESVKKRVTPPEETPEFLESAHHMTMSHWLVFTRLWQEQPQGILHEIQYYLRNGQVPLLKLDARVHPTSEQIATTVVEENLQALDQRHQTHILVEALVSNQILLLDYLLLGEVNSNSPDAPKYGSQYRIFVLKIQASLTFEQIHSSDGLVNLGLVIAISPDGIFCNGKRVKSIDEIVQILRDAVITEEYGRIK